MSLILDALKKLEQEKAARRQGMGLGTAVVYGRSPARRRRRGAVIAGTGAVLVLACGMLFAVGKERQPGAPPAAVTPAPTVIEPRPATASPSAPPTLPTALPTSLAREPARISPVAALPASATTPPSPSVLEEGASQPVPPANDLKVTGIAWQEERGSRRAVVNGLLLGEGAEVAGARILDIKTDRVRFSRDGQELVIPLATPFGAK